MSWLDLTDLGQAGADLDAIDALLDGYESVRPLSPAEAVALPAVFPVVHVEYALSEVEYFAHVVSSPANADLAYDGFLLGHAAWFETAEGAAVLDHLRRRAARGACHGLSAARRTPGGSHAQNLPAAARGGRHVRRGRARGAGGPGRGGGQHRPGVDQPGAGRVHRHRAPSLR